MCKISSFAKLLSYVSITYLRRILILLLRQGTGQQRHMADQRHCRHRRVQVSYYSTGRGRQMDFWQSRVTCLFPDSCPFFYQFFTLKSYLSLCYVLWSLQSSQDVSKTLVYYVIYFLFLNFDGNGQNRCFCKVSGNRDQNLIPDTTDLFPDSRKNFYLDILWVNSNSLYYFLNIFQYILTKIEESVTKISLKIKFKNMILLNCRISAITNLYIMQIVFIQFI